jgi:23S rRNA pseudouridine1911/1915/1917 synthase
VKKPKKGATADVAARNAEPADDSAADDSADDDSAADDSAADDSADDDSADDDSIAAHETERSVTTHRFVVPFSLRGERIDVVLVRFLPTLSRSRGASLVDQGQVSVGGARVKPSHKVRGGDEVYVVVPPPAPVTLVPEHWPLTVVFDDPDFCVIDKPAGLVVHPGPGHESGTIAHALLGRFPDLVVGGERRPGIVHRLDKDTSGLLVVAKNEQALHALARQFHDRTVVKRYLALCLGMPSEPGHPIDVVTGHARAVGDRRRFTSRLAPPESASGRAGELRGVRRAESRFTVLQARDGVALVDVLLRTGRTHQIRVHLADRGHPLLQDALYGGAHAERRLKPGAVRDAVAVLKRQALHAASLALCHPKTGTALSFESPLPADLQAVVAALDAS